MISQRFPLVHFKRGTVISLRSNTSSAFPTQTPLTIVTVESPNKSAFIKLI